VVAVGDGTRLATCIDVRRGDLRGTLLVRGAEPVQTRSALPWLAQRLAGRGSPSYSEMPRAARLRRADPTREASGGADTITWLTQQSWYAPPLAGRHGCGSPPPSAPGASPWRSRTLVGHAARDPPPGPRRRRAAP
jgi:hypothetical protein